MDSDRDIVAELEEQLTRIQSEVARLSAEIAAELLAQPPRNSARVTGARYRITELVRQYAPVSQRIGAAQAAAAAEAREEGIPGGRLPQRWYRLGTRAHFLRMALNRWDRVQTLIDAQQPPRRRPLYRESGDAEDIVAAQNDLTDALLGSLHRLLNGEEQDPAAEEFGAYADIALPHSRFAAHAHAAYRVLLARNVTSSDFIDVGCGGGLKVLAASYFFGRATGIDLDAGYTRAAGSLFDSVGRRNCRVLTLDAASFPDYRFYDVVYLYRPMRDEEPMKQLEELIASQLRPGTVLIAPYRGFAARHEALGCARIAGSLFVAGLKREEADRLREAAEYTGSYTGRRKPDLPDVWEPILDASSARGFGIREESWVDRV